jgi:hypothetical protein
MSRISRLYPKLSRVGNKRVLKPTVEADVNIVDDIDQPSSLELTDVSTYPGGEQPDKHSLFPNKQRFNPYDVTRGASISMFELAAEFGVNLRELDSPSIGGGFQDNPADNHHSDNIDEDADLKLGEVEAPYSSSDGPLNVRFDEDHKFNITKGAQSDLEDEPPTNRTGPEYQDISTDNDNLREQADAVAREHGITAPDDLEEIIYAGTKQLLAAGKRQEDLLRVSYNSGLNRFNYILRLMGDGRGDVQLLTILNGTARLDEDVDVRIDGQGGDDPRVDGLANQVYFDLLGAISDNIHSIHPEKQASFYRLAAVSGLVPAFYNRLTKEIIQSPGHHDLEVLPINDQDTFGGSANPWLDGFATDKGRFLTRGQAAIRMGLEKGDRLTSEELNYLESGEADLEDKEAVGLIEGPISDENIQEVDSNRPDSAIPRPPNKERLIYSKRR